MFNTKNIIDPKVKADVRNPNTWDPYFSPNILILTDGNRGELALVQITANNSHIVNRTFDPPTSIIVEEKMICPHKANTSNFLKLII